MKLTKEECLNELKILCNYADMSASGEFVGKMLQDADDTLHKLIDEHFELQLTRGECDLIEFALKPLEEELGMDVTLLIDKIKKHKRIAPKEEGVVECVEFETN